MVPKGIPVHLVSDGRIRGKFLERQGYAKKGINPWKMFQQIREMRRIARTARYDVLHFWGMAPTAQFAGLMNLLGVGMTVCTVSGFPKNGIGTLGKWLMEQAGALITSTEYSRGRWAEEGISATLISHANIRDLRAELGDEPPAERNSVLFWRDLTPLNGADICLQVYRELAPRYPHIDFVLAVRPWFEEVPGAEELSREFGNVKLYRFPYPEGVSLPRLMNRALCVLLPFRGLTIHPQMAVVESLAFGRPVITTSVQSNIEYVKHEENGLLIPPGNVNATIRAVQQLIETPDIAEDMGDRAKQKIALQFSWEKHLESLLERYYELIGKT